MKTERTPFFYMANLGSEMHRYLSFLEKRDTIAADSAWERVQDIVQKILSFESMKSRQPEVEALVSFVENPLKIGLAIAEVKKQCDAYFLPFANRVLRV